MARSDQSSDAECRRVFLAVRVLNRQRPLGADKKFSFLVDSATGQPRVLVIDRRTKAVIEELAPLQVLAMVRMLSD